MLYFLESNDVIIKFYACVKKNDFATVLENCIFFNIKHFDIKTY